MIERIIDSSPTRIQTPSWNYASFDIIDPDGFHARPAFFTYEALSLCPGKVETAVTRDLFEETIYFPLGESLLDFVFREGNISAKKLHVRYDSPSKEIDSALKTIESALGTKWENSRGRRYAKG